MLFEGEACNLMQSETLLRPLVMLQLLCTLEYLVALHKVSRMLSAKVVLFGI